MGNFNDHAAKGRTSPSDGFIATDAARLNTWMVEIASEARGLARPVGIRQWRVGANGALLVHPDASFHDFSVNAHGYGAIDLIRLLQGSDAEGAVRWGRDWLASHAGDGRLGRGGVQQEDEAEILDAVERLAMIEAMWDRSLPIAGTRAENYLASRQLNLTMENAEQLRWQPEARGFGEASEGAMVAALRDNEGTLVAIQLTFIDSSGKKSSLNPVRVTLRGPADWNRRGAVRFTTQGGGVSPKITICEGVEDALSARAAAAEHVWAVLGVGRIGTVGLPITVDQIVVVRDDDPPESPADFLLIRGLVRLLGQGVKVSVTKRPNEIAGEGHSLKDVNDLHRHDAALVKELLATASKPILKGEARDAAIDEASRLDSDAYEQGREKIARWLDWRVGTLDKSRASRIDERKQTSGDKGASIEDEPWEDPVTDLGAVLDEIVAELARYVVASTAFLHTVALWAAFSHALHREDLEIGVSPRLAIQSPMKRCGKTVLLEAIACLTPRPDMNSSISPASLFRVIDEEQVTVLIDEADLLLHRNVNPELLLILNAGHRKSTAYVRRIEKNDNGRQKQRRFNTFTAIAFAGIKQLPETLQDRSIVITLKRAFGGEVREHLVNGRSGILVDGRRKLARWRLDARSLPMIDRPIELSNRLGDNWYPLRQIAAVAGGEWPARAMAAALGNAHDDPNAEQNVTVALLQDIWQVFYDKKVVRMHTRFLVGELLGMSEGRWDEANRGKRINEYFLREHLADLLPKTKEALKTRRWRDGGGESLFGYTEDHLQDAWRRYLSREPPSKAGHDRADPSMGAQPDAPNATPDPSLDPEPNIEEPEAVHTTGARAGASETEDGKVESADEANSANGPSSVDEAKSPLPRGARGRRPRGNGADAPQ
jgi:putative DNA primase/helicase